MKTSALRTALLLAPALSLLACGGGGSSTASPTAGGGTISGSVILAPVSGASVRAYAVTGGVMGAQVGASTTDATGNFTISIGHYSGPVMIQASGGGYVDEATATVMAMQAGDAVACALPSVGADATTTGVQVTPLTAMAQAMAQAMTGGMTPDNVRSANADVGSYFMVGDIVATMPVDPSVAGSGVGATQDQRNYGMSIAAMSQYAAGLGMTDSSAMVTAMARDASDGVMNGMMGSTAISMSGMGGMMGGSGMMAANAGTTGLASAMTAFVGSSKNRSGVGMTDVQPLVTKLGASDGTIP